MGRPGRHGREADRRLAACSSAARIVLVTLALAGCGGATRVGAADPDAHVLTLMNPIGDTQEITIYAQEVARLSKGKLRIRIVRSPHQGKIGYEAAVIDDVRAGRSDLAWAGSRAWKGSLRTLNAPLLIDSYELQQRVLEDDLVAPMLDELEPLGLKGIGVLPGPLRRPFGLHGRLSPHVTSGPSRSAHSSRAWRSRPCARSAHVRFRWPRRETTPGLDGVESAMIGAPVGKLRPRRRAPVVERQPVAAPARRVRQRARVRRALLGRARRPARGGRP